MGTQTPESALPPRSWVVRHKSLCICIGLISSVAGLYVQTADFTFIGLDDPDYVYLNPHVVGGPTRTNIEWAFTHSHSSNWHPLTWLSHMLDWQLYGSWAGGHHLTSVLIHALDAVLLFLALRHLTGDTNPSALVAAVFAIHPLHVESVAWVAERKDVLSGLFFCLTLLAYSHYVTKPGPGRYALVALAFACGLMSKPMLVTLPCVLLLLDYWPLRRLTLEAGKLKWVLLEKVPLFALTLASAAITIVAQKAGGAISAGERGGFGITVESGPAEQIANALVSYVMYMVQTIYPSGLGIFYPHPAYSGEPIPAWEIIGSAAVLIAVSVWAIRLSHERPYLLVGWLWFIGMLVPVIGLLQVGLQARADRYTYLPQIGLCIALTWYIADVVPPRKLVMPAILVLAALAVLAWHQIQRWHDAETVMGHALTVAPPTWLTEISYGTILLERNRVEEAIPHLRSAFRLGTGHAQSRHCLVMGLTIQGDNLARNGEFAKAASSFEEALALDPESDTTRKQLLMVLQTLGIMKARQGRPDEAAVWFHRAVELDPTNPTAHYNLGRALLDAGRPREASACFKCVLELDPGNAAARANLQRLEQEKSR